MKEKVLPECGALEVNEDKKHLNCPLLIHKRIC